MSTTMIHLRQLTAYQKQQLTDALSALRQYPAGRPVSAFVSALGISPQAAKSLIAELEREKFIRVTGDLVHADMNATGGGKIVFSHGTARRKEILAKSALGRKVLAEEQGR